MRRTLLLLCVLPFFSCMARAEREVPLTDCDRYAASDFGQTKSGVPFEKIDPRAAIPACEVAVRIYPGSTRLVFELGRSYLKGGSFNAALARFRQAAERGYPPAMNSIGSMYFDGSGVSKDEGKAIAWYRKAAERGDVSGQLNLALAYENGRGVPRNYVSALEWYRKAADQGSAIAQDSIGYFYGQGMGVKKNDAESVIWFRKAAEQGMAGAQYNLGTDYQHGRGVPASPSEALAWYAKAAAQGCEPAKRKLDELKVSSIGAPHQPAAKGSPLPAIHNSPDTECDYQRQCTDSEFVSVRDSLQRQWALAPEWLRAKCVSNSTYPSIEQCILNQTVSWLNTHPNAQAPWINPDNIQTKPNSMAVTARGVSVVPGAIVCPDHDTVRLIFDMYVAHWTDAQQDAMTNGQSRLLRGKPSPAPDLKLYGCALLPSGTHMMLERGNIVPIVTAKLPDGTTIRGVTLEAMIVSQ
ncbi:MAG: tetratricopeptide repeat protein [Rhizomicrobium sp.]|jgi:TPR repeat protein